MSDSLSAHARSVSSMKSAQRAYDNESPPDDGPEIYHNECEVCGKEFTSTHEEESVCDDCS